MPKEGAMALGRRWARGSDWCACFWCIGVLLLGWQSATASPPAAAAGAVDQYGLAIAEAFVRNSATFRYDGLPKSLRLQSVRPLAACPGCYEYVLSFESQHPGFGDRASVPLTQAPTPHQATIILRDHTVVSGVLDAAWDMAQQRILDFE
jgi:hypothetical protein